jgi:hypothetical protein
MTLLFELPICRKALEKTFLFAMSPLGGQWPARWRNSGEAGGCARAEVDAGWSRGAPGPVWGFGQGQGAAGDGARRRRRPEPVAVAHRAAKDEYARDDTRLHKLG